MPHCGHMFHEKCTQFRLRQHDGKGPKILNTRIRLWWSARTIRNNLLKSPNTMRDGIGVLNRWSFGRCEFRDEFFIAISQRNPFKTLLTILTKKLKSPPILKRNTSKKFLAFNFIYNTPRHFIGNPSILNGQPILNALRMMPCQSHDKVTEHWMLVLQFEQYIKKVGADVIEILGKSSVLVEMETHYRPPSFRWCRRLLINVKTATPLK